LNKENIKSLFGENESMNKGWWNDLKIEMMNQIQSNFQYFEKKNEQDLFEITNFLFELYQESKSERLRIEFENLKNKFIPQFEDEEIQMTLSLKFKHFQKLIELANFDISKLREYVETFQEDSFFSILFQEYKKIGRNKELLEIGKYYPDLFSKLIGNDLNLKWLNAIQMNNYKLSSNCLEILSNNENQSFKRKKNLMSISKLCSILSDDCFVESKESVKIECQKYLTKEGVIKDDKPLNEYQLTEICLSNQSLVSSELKTRIAYCFELSHHFNFPKDYLYLIWKKTFELSSNLFEDFDDKMDREIEGEIASSLFFSMINDNFKKRSKLTFDILNQLKNEFIPQINILEQIWEIQKN
jgi:hypothetical protein